MMLRKSVKHQFFERLNCCKDIIFYRLFWISDRFQTIDSSLLIHLTRVGLNRATAANVLLLTRNSPIRL